METLMQLQPRLQQEGDAIFLLCIGAGTGGRTSLLQHPSPPQAASLPLLPRFPSFLSPGHGSAGAILQRCRPLSAEVLNVKRAGEQCPWEDLIGARHGLLDSCGCRQRHHSSLQEALPLCVAGPTGCCSMRAITGRPALQGLQARQGQRLSYIDFFISLVFGDCLDVSSPSGDKAINVFIGST